VLGHVGTLGNLTRRRVADGGARVPEVLTATKLEGLVTGVIIAELREPADSPAMSTEHIDVLREPPRRAGFRPICPLLAVSAAFLLH
jgi:hypothetical protein